MRAGLRARAQLALGALRTWPRRYELHGRPAAREVAASRSRARSGRGRGRARRSSPAAARRRAHARGCRGAAAGSARAASPSACPPRRAGRGRPPPAPARGLRPGARHREREVDLSGPQARTKQPRPGPAPRSRAGRWPAGGPRVAPGAPRASRSSRARAPGRDHERSSACATARHVRAHHDHRLAALQELAGYAGDAPRRACPSPARAGPSGSRADERLPGRSRTPCHGPDDRRLSRARAPATTGRASTEPRHSFRSRLHHRVLRRVDNAGSDRGGVRNATARATVPPPESSSRECCPSSPIARTSPMPHGRHQQRGLAVAGSERRQQPQLVRQRADRARPPARSRRPGATGIRSSGESARARGPRTPRGRRRSGRARSRARRRRGARRSGPGARRTRLAPRAGRSRGSSARAAAGIAVEPDDHDRPVMALGQARGHDPDHARVPVLARQDVRRVASYSARAASAANRIRRLAIPALAVQQVELVRHLGGAARPRSARAPARPPRCPHARPH